MQLLHSKNFIFLHLSSARISIVLLLYTPQAYFLACYIIWTACLFLKLVFISPIRMLDAVNLDRFPQCGAIAYCLISANFSLDDGCAIAFACVRLGPLCALSHNSYMRYVCDALSISCPKLAISFTHATHSRNTHKASNQPFCSSLSLSRDWHKSGQLVLRSRLLLQSLTVSYTQYSLLHKCCTLFMGHLCWPNLWFAPIYSV